MLAEASGWKSKVANAVERAAREAGAGFCARVEDLPQEPCEHLVEHGCSFPRDLRPFGCTIYVCPVMYREMDRKQLARVRRLVRALSAAHEALLHHIDLSPSAEDTNEA